MTQLKYIALLIFLGVQLVYGQSDLDASYSDDVSWDFNQEDLLNNDEDLTDKSENSFRDTLNKQYINRTFRNKWRENYQGILFDYDERISEKSSTNWDWDWDLSGLFKILSFLAKIIGYGLIALVVFLVVRAVLTDSGISLKAFRQKNKAYSVVEEGDISIDEDWLKRALEAKNRGDLKSAVRFYFLAYLKQLHFEQHIDFHPDKSNRVYRYEINDQNLRNDFDVLSRVFDYCWYGDFEINQEQFIRVEVLFSTHVKK
jgi:hypothetical protein